MADLRPGVPTNADIRRPLCEAIFNIVLSGGDTATLLRVIAYLESRERERHDGAMH